MPTSDEQKRCPARRIGALLAAEFDPKMVLGVVCFFVYGGAYYGVLCLVADWVPETTAWSLRMEWLAPVALFVGFFVALVGAYVTAEALLRRRR